MTLSPRQAGRSVQKVAHSQPAAMSFLDGPVPPRDASPEPAGNAPHGAVRFLAEPAEKDEMKLLKDICIVVPTVVVTATAVLGVATVIGLSSWALL